MKSQDDGIVDLIKRMSEGVQMVKLGLYLRLINSLKDTCGMEKAKWLAAAIVNELFSEPAPDTKAKMFLESNRTFIEQIISEMRGNKEVCEAVTQAVRVKGIIGNFVGGDTQEVLMSPLEKLKRLGILVPGGKTPEPDSFLSMAREFQGLEQKEKQVEGKQLYSESEKQVASDQPPTKPAKGSILKLNRETSKYGFWSKVQMISLFLFISLVIMCFVWNWWLVIPALVFLVLNGIAYANRMKSLRRDPSTRDIKKVV